MCCSCIFSMIHIKLLVIGHIQIYQFHFYVITFISTVSTTKRNFYSRYFVTSHGSVQMFGSVYSELLCQLVMLYFWYVLQIMKSACRHTVQITATCVSLGPAYHDDGRSYCCWRNVLVWARFCFVGYKLQNVDSVWGVHSVRRLFFHALWNL
jgi:hypothetical protein